jgi:hypothetical protein
MRKYENRSKQKLGKNACADLGNNCSIHLSYEGANFDQNIRFRFFAKLHRDERSGTVAWQFGCRVGAVVEVQI